jgi:hypothetical protein
MIFIDGIPNFILIIIKIDSKIILLNIIEFSKYFLEYIIIQIIDNNNPKTGE